jgi:hypothetical protein
MKENAVNTPKQSDESPVFESFPEYHNFPPLWDLSELDRPARPACSGHGEPSVQMGVQLSGSDNTGAEAPFPVGDAYPVFNRDPFPKLKTLPVHWDLSR